VDPAAQLQLPATNGDESPSAEDKSRRTRKSQAFLRSVLIPGWGQLHDDRRTAGYGFLAAEAILLGGVVFSKTYSRWLEDDYRTFAAQHAGVSRDSEHQYYVDIGNWMDRASYNEARLRDRQFDAMYTTPGTDWHWDSDANRRHFKDIRIKSDTYGQTAILFIGGLILNHVASAVEAGRGASNTSPISIQPTVSASGASGIAARVNMLRLFQ